MKIRQRQFGMSMFGIVIVMMIVGVLTATLAPMLLSQHTQSTEESDRGALEAAKTALVGYALSNGKLPSPVDASGNIATLLGVVQACDANGVVVPFGTAGSTACRMPPSAGAGTGVVPSLGVNNYGMFGKDNAFRMDVNDALVNAIGSDPVKALCMAAQVQLTTPGPGPRVCQDAACTVSTPVAFVLYSTGHDHVPNLSNALTTRIYQNDSYGIDNSPDAVSHYDDQLVSYPLSSLVTDCAKWGGKPICNPFATPASLPVGGGTTTLTANCSNSPDSFVWSHACSPASVGPTCNVSLTTTTVYSVTGHNDLGDGPLASTMVPVGTVPSNLALSGTASASGQFSASYPVASVNNDERMGSGWGTGSGPRGWNDNTLNNFTDDWVQIQLPSSQAIDKVVVYTLQDNYNSPVEPDDTTIFTLYGITDFQVQGWNAGTSTWDTLGTVSGNNLVKRMVSFVPYTTDKIRIKVTGALGGYSRITEIEAYASTATAPVCTLTASSTFVVAGDTVTLTASCSNSPTSYNWAGTPGSFTSFTTSGTVTPAASTTYYVGAVNGYGTSLAASATVIVTPSALSNVALAGTATASTTHVSGNFPVASVNNNERAGTGWADGNAAHGGWNDNTNNDFTNDWVQIAFGATKTIYQVVVYTVQDNYATPIEPTDNMTFTTYGITGFTIQGWNAGTSTWDTLGTVNGNSLVKRTVSFLATPYTTDSIRVQVTSGNGYSRITEVESWGY